MTCGIPRPSVTRVSTPHAVRTIARAAAQLAALAQPDVAAVIASLPRRPGSTASLAELASTSGLEMRTLGRAVARGRDAGLLRVDGEEIGLDPDGARAAVAELVALTPLGAALAERPDLRDLAPYGVVPGVPSGPGTEELLRIVADLLPSEEMSEPQVTGELATMASDAVGLRRALVDAGLLWRTADGSRYWRADAR